VNASPTGQACLLALCNGSAQSKVTEQTGVESALASTSSGFARESTFIHVSQLWLSVVKHFTLQLAGVRKKTKIW